MVVDLAARARLRPVVALAAAGVLVQIGYPLVSGAARAQLAIAVVALFAAAAVCHAALTRGAAVAAVLVLSTVVLGFAVEVVGVATGIPFGTYQYGSALGPQVLGVPVVIAFAWTMLAWPAALVARRLVRGFATRVALGGWALAAWDLFLDPQMVRAGYWHWADHGSGLPGVPSVPVTDYAGWLAVATLVSFLLQRSMRTAGESDDTVPCLLFVWTWASSALALAVFLGLPAAAAYGALAMGTVAVPLLRQW